MALQSDNVVMVGLGVLGDAPPNALQPPLVDGIHLRWSFRRELGFPWFGAFLFRRAHRPGKPVCLGQTLSKMRTGTWPSANLNTPYGRVDSDRRLVFTDDFPAAGATEFDLRGRHNLRFSIDPARPAYRVEARIGIRDKPRGDGETDDDSHGAVRVQALHGGFVVDERKAQGQPGEVVTVAVESDAISAVRVSGGQAAVVDFCIYFVSQNVTAGWEVVPSFQYPMSLPVRHPQYPCSPQPTDRAASEALALSRVRYGSPTAWTGAPFAELHARLVDLVQDGPAGSPMAEQSSPVVGTATPPDAEVGSPTMLNQYPLELVLFASLHPAIAQMIGMYWADQTVDPDRSYDYLIVADHTGIGNRKPATVLDVIRTQGFVELDGYIVFDQRMASAPPLKPPGDVRCYALSGTTVAAQDGDLLDATNNAGLRWDVDKLAPGVLEPGSALMYHVWRDERGNAADPDAPGTYTVVTRNPVLVAEPTISPGVTPTRPADWPPFPLHHVDRALPEGWYSYRVSGIDIFGRHSPNSDDARWFQWVPEPQPRPWYYQSPPADSVLHPSAVRLLDKLGPPPPHAVEAFALDPADPTVLKDALFTGWHDTLSEAEKRSLVGLRVRWRWTEAHMRQAPDTREFRIYLQPDSLNSLAGRITNVAPASATESDVQTDITDPHGANAYVGAWLRVGAHAFRVVASAGNAALVLRVKNIGAADDVAPPVDAACTLTVPRVYNTGRVSVFTGSQVVTGTDTLWTAHLVGMTFKAVGEFATYAVEAVNSPTELVLDRDYEASNAIGRPYGIRFPLYTDFNVAVSWQERFYVVPQDEHVTVTTDGAGRPLRRYEVIIPVQGDDVRAGLQLATSPADPIRYAHIGVTAADDKQHTTDDPKWAAGSWGGGDRFGNEGPVSAPATIFVIHRTPPPAPTVPADSERVFASPADYHSHSFYTYRWVPAPHLKTHVFRALDDAVFKADWRRRAADTSDLDPDQTERFPSEWGAAKRQQVAAELNHLNGFEHDAHTSQAMDYYRGLSNDALRTLAGLPGNDRAFAQLTIQPLDPADAANANRLGPDDSADYVLDSGLRAYIDTLDGRSTSRYFYRTAYVDAVHNRGPLSLSSPPVWLPDVVPPRMPVVTGILGGERRITLEWSSNREPDIADYRIYRAADAAAARDIRLMTLVRTEAVPGGDPSARPPTVSWTDEPVFDLVTFTYRVVAVDDGGNLSDPTPPIAARAIDTAPPMPAVWTDAAWIRLDPAGGEHDWMSDAPNHAPAVRLEWDGADIACEYLTQRRAGVAAMWQTVMPWATGRRFVDDAVDPAADYEYQVVTRKANGRTSMSISITPTGR